jgi:hypothetical protein
MVKRKSKKMYKIKSHKNKTYKKKYLGGSTDTPLAYTGHSQHLKSNPFLAYVGKGGSSCNLPKNASLPINQNASNPAYPNTGPKIQPNTIFNTSSAQRGGNCGCGLPFMKGGYKHRIGCKCSKCKKIMKGGNPGIPYPDGLVGKPWTPNISNWPGVDGIPGDRNYLSNNLYKNDPQTSMKNIGPSPPFIKGGNKKNKKGGTLSNSIGQDFINLGRQLQYGVGSAYNALAGYTAPTNPMPWKGQFPNSQILKNSVLL